MFKGNDVAKAKRDLDDAIPKGVYGSNSHGYVEPREACEVEFFDSENE